MTTALSEWTLQQQRQFWQRCAHDIIGRWGLDDVQLAWVGYGSNAVFRVGAACGDYVLRLHAPGRIRAHALRSEMVWLRHIRANTALIVPLPVAIKDNGEPVYIAQVAGDPLPQPNAVYGCLFHYIEGRSKSADAFSTSDMSQLGAFLGELHGAGQFRPTDEFSRPRLDWQGLFGDDSPYSGAELKEWLTTQQSGVFSEVAARVKSTMQALDDRADSFGMIHGDLLAKNVLFTGDKLAALDFEYCAWGYFLYDLAPMLWQLKGDRARDYEALEDALWAGYAARRPHSNVDRQALEDFVAARQLASCRWLMANMHLPHVRAAARDLIAARTNALRAYLDTGSLRRGTPTL